MTSVVGLVHAVREPLLHSIDHELICNKTCVVVSQLTYILHSLNTRQCQINRTQNLIKVDESISEVRDATQRANESEQSIPTRISGVWTYLSHRQRIVRASYIPTLIYTYIHTDYTECVRSHKKKITPPVFSSKGITAELLYLVLVKARLSPQSRKIALSVLPTMATRRKSSTGSRDHSEQKQK